MKVLAINGSPRKGGNTDVIIDSFLEGAGARGAEIEKIVLSDFNISPCQEIEYEEITENGLSVVNDHMSVVFEKIGWCDVLVLGSPVYFGSITAQLKTMIDRFQCVWLAKNIYNVSVFMEHKRGFFICTSASARRDFFENSRAVIKHFFATINFEYTQELFLPGVDKKGDAFKHPDFIKKAHDMGIELL